jgi:hypothetical protein
MKMKQLKIIASMFVAILLTACGGGGGGSSSTTTFTAFTKYDDVSPGDRVEISGLSTEADYEQALLTSTITSSTPTGSVDSGALVRMSYDSSGALEELKIVSAGGTELVFDSQSTFTLGTEYTSVTNSSADATAAYGTLTNWDYTAFGVWGAKDTALLGNLGAFSMGAETSGGSIPVSASATYTGNSLGYYTASDGSLSIVQADLTANADFANRIISISSTNSYVNIIGGGSGYVSPLDYNGTLSYPNGVNVLTGTLSLNNGLNGPVAGRFYGPNAEELGATFSMTLGGTGIESYIGAFGASK